MATQRTRQAYIQGYRAAQKKINSGSAKEGLMNWLLGRNQEMKEQTRQRKDSKRDEKERKRIAAEQELQLRKDQLYAKQIIAEFETTIKYAADGVEDCNDTLKFLQAFKDAVVRANASFHNQLPAQIPNVWKDNTGLVDFGNEVLTKPYNQLIATIDKALGHVRAIQAGYNTLMQQAKVQKDKFTGLSADVLTPAAIATFTSAALSPQALKYAASTARQLIRMRAKLDALNEELDGSTADVKELAF